MKIYTKTGDKGQTGLVDGQRVSKSSLILSCYGEVDELNSHVGVIVSFIDSEFETTKEELKYIQNKLFDLGSLLACPFEKREKFNLKKIDESDISYLELCMDRMSEVLPPLKNFILPGGSQCSSFIHIARSFCRRLERSCVGVLEHNENDLPENALIYINRLSDYFFILSRFINLKHGESEVIWKNT